MQNNSCPQPYKFYQNSTTDFFKLPFSSQRRRQMNFACIHSRERNIIEDKAMNATEIIAGGLRFNSDPAMAGRA